jgi:hypothetical protein
MTNESRDPREQFTARWVRACATGWIGGLALVLLLAVLWDLVGGVAQFMVGVGMGAGVGWSQSRMLRHWLIKPGSWVLASTVGMGAPFVLSDIVALLGGSIYALSWCAVVGGAIAGVWQARLLRDNVSHTGRWWLWSMLGWAVPVLIISVGDYSDSPAVGVLSLACMFLGGIILGAVTGPAINRMLPASTPSGASTV